MSEYRCERWSNRKDGDALVVSDEHQTLQLHGHGVAVENGAALDLTGGQIGNRWFLNHESDWDFFMRASLHQDGGVMMAIQHANGTIKLLKQLDYSSSSEYNWHVDSRDMSKDCYFIIKSPEHKVHINIVTMNGDGPDLA